MPRYKVPLARAVWALFMERGEVSAAEACRVLCEERGLCKRCMSVYAVFRFLHELGLIRLVDTYDVRGGVVYEKLYEMTPGLEHHPCWNNPKCCYEPRYCTPRQYEEYWKSGVAKTLWALRRKLEEKKLWR